MGKQFLKELYRGFLIEPSGLCLVEIDRKDVVGFVVGTTQFEGFFSRLLRTRWPAFLGNIETEVEEYDATRVLAETE
jgi:hypothetical protein